MDGFDLKLVRGEATGGTDGPIHSVERVAFLVDCSDTMDQTYQGPLLSLQGLTLFQVAVKQISDIVAAKLARGVEDDMIIVWFNRGVDVWYAAGTPTLALLERLDDLQVTHARDTQIDRADGRQGKGASLVESLRDAMVRAFLGFGLDEWKSHKIDVSLVIAVWTTDNNAALDGDDPALESILELMRRRNIHFHTILLDRVERDSSVTGSLWEKLCLADCTHGHNTRSLVANPFTLRSSPRLVSHTDSLKLDCLSGTSKHSSFLVPWHVGSLGILHLRFYSLTSSAWPRCVGVTKWVDARESSVLVTPKIIPSSPDEPLCEPMDDTGQPYYPKTTGKKGSSAPRLMLSKEVVEKLKSPVPFRRAFLIGFKPYSWLAEEWQMGHAHFMHPDEESSLDMRQRCKALHDVMVEQNVLAVCGFIPSDHSEPRLAAILPSTSKEGGNALGFSMMELPFADDIRHPEEDVYAMGKPQRIPATGLLWAEKLITTLRVGKNELPGVAIHPHVRRHLEVLQAVLLDRPLGECSDIGADKWWGRAAEASDDSKLCLKDMPVETHGALTQDAM